MKHKELKEHILYMLESEKNSFKVKDLFQKKLQSFGGKLYKYYSFSNEFALSNLENDIIFFSKPESFNDPFDCYMGLSAEKTVQTLLLKLINKMSIKDCNDDYTKEIACALLCGEPANLTSKTNPKIQLVTFLAKDKDLMNLMKSKKIKNDISKEEVLSFLAQKSRSDPMFIIELVKLISNNPAVDSAQIKADLAKNITLLFSPEMIDLLNYCMPEDCSAEGVNTINTLNQATGAKGIKNKILAIEALTGKKTDTIKAIEEFENNIPQILNHTYSSINKKFCITCFADRPDNVLMWSHYADKHCGFCVEYDFNRCDCYSLIGFLFNVIYDEERPNIPFSMMNFDQNGELIFDTTNKEWIADVILALLTKSKNWEYEDEWRIIAPTNKVNEQKISQDIVSAVYLGVNANQENIEKIKQCIVKKNETRAVEHNIEIYKYSLDKESYRLVKEKLLCDS